MSGSIRVIRLIDLRAVVRSMVLRDSIWVPAAVVEVEDNVMVGIAGSSGIGL